MLKKRDSLSGVKFANFVTLHMAVKRCLVHVNAKQIQCTGVDAHTDLLQETLIKK